MSRSNRIRSRGRRNRRGWGMSQRVESTVESLCRLTRAEVADARSPVHSCRGVRPALNVEPPIQTKLLDLAAVDAELTRIEHRRRVLPEQQEVQRLEAARTARKDAAVKVEIQL